MAALSASQVTLTGVGLVALAFKALDDLFGHSAQCSVLFVGLSPQRSSDDFDVMGRMRGNLRRFSKSVRSKQFNQTRPALSGVSNPSSRSSAARIIACSQEARPA